MEITPERKLFGEMTEKEIIDILVEENHKLRMEIENVKDELKKLKL